MYLNIRVSSSQGMESISTDKANGAYSEYSGRTPGKLIDGTAA